MKFKIDENLPGDVVNDVRAAGHDADTVHDEGLAGSPDSVVMASVQAEGRAILTLDKGIADVRVYPPSQYAGLILLRPRTTGRLATLAFVRRHLPTLLQSPLAGHLYVVTETGIRVR
jgi:predicted nuclease of predicted toxin-antitoxin system